WLRPSLEDAGVVLATMGQQSRPDWTGHMAVTWTRTGTSTLLIATTTVCAWLGNDKRGERTHPMRWHRPRPLHPAVPELQEQLCAGNLDRREFLRTVMLLGVTASAAYAMLGRLTGQPLVPRVQAAG